MGKTFTKNLIVFFILLTSLGSIKTFAQLDSLVIIPSNPTTNDTVKVAAYITFFSAGCNLVDANVSQAGSSFDVEACYYVGMLPALCSRVDTFVLGKLSEGLYSVQFSIDQSTSDTACENATSQGTGNTSFAVSPFTMINNVTTNKASLTLFPNPSSGIVTINYTVSSQQNQTKPQLVFYNSMGQVVKQISLENQSGSLVGDLSDLDNGIYLYRMEGIDNYSDLQKLHISQ